MRACIWIMLAFAIVGCGQTQPPAPENEPLTLEKWEQLPAEERYTAVSYERLKLGESKFQDERTWNAFYRKVVVPGDRQRSTGMQSRR
jgi:hypothetical protein